MWVRTEKERRHLSMYAYGFALLLFFMVLHLNYIKNILLCNTLRLCERNEHKVDIEFQAEVISDDAPGTDEIQVDVNGSSNSFLHAWKKKILIYSLPRSGSSFLGEIFNRRSDVFYVYEPLHTLTIFSKVGSFEPYEYMFKAADVLRDFLRCKFDKYDEHLKFLSYPELCSPHFRLMSQVLSSPPFCKKLIFSNVSEKEYRRNCITLIPQMVQEHCMAKKNIVIKELVHRLPLQGINGILPLFKDNLFRVICLIRDPRAVISSMMTVGVIGNYSESFANSFETAADKICKILGSQYESLNLPDLVIKNKLTALRYEDMVTQPEKTIKTLFSFLDIDIIKEDIQWVVENTHGQLDNVKDSFSVFFRNISYSLNSWRRTLTFNQINLIQRKCGLTMEKFGYVLFDSSNEVFDLSNPAFNHKFQLESIIRML